MTPELLPGVSVVHNGTVCRVHFARYTENLRTAILLTEEDTGEPYAMASVNLPDVALAPDEVAVKDYSENDGMLAALAAAGVAEPTGRTIDSGHVTVPVARLLKTPSWLT